MKKIVLFIFFCFLHSNHAGIESLLLHHPHIDSGILLGILTNKDAGENLQRAHKAQLVIQKKRILQTHFNPLEVEQMLPILHDICEVIDESGIAAVKQYYNIKTHEANKKIHDIVTKAATRVAGRRLNARATI